MYPFLRNVHLYSSFFLLIFITMYFVSGYLMVHEPWFHREDPARKPATVTLDPTQANAPPNSEEFARWLQAQVKLPGQAHPGQRQGNTWVYYIERPGTNYKVEVPQDFSKATIQESNPNLVGTTIRVPEFGSPIG